MAENTALYNAGYVIKHEQDGVYLYIENRHIPDCITPHLIVYDLMRRNVTGINRARLLVQIKRGQTLIKAAQPQLPKAADSTPYVTISKDMLAADMQLLPAVQGGRRLSYHEILAAVKSEWGVVFGLSEEAIRQAVEQESYFEQKRIANGKAPCKGRDGYLEYFFKTHRSYAPYILEDGSADYKRLNRFAGVEADDVLVRRIPPGEGTFGFNVKGERLSAEPGREVSMPKGRNVRLSPDGACLIAEKSGRVDVKNNRVEVADTYVIPGDVDMGIGNIEFAGDVKIGGNVISGLSVKAEGSIEVLGSVEAATLIAGADIIIKRGILGMDKGCIKAEGNVVSQFIERSNVAAGGSVYSDCIVHSTVSAEADVIIKGRRGRIIGGVIRAGGRIVAKDIGTRAGETTLLEIGFSPELKSELLQKTKLDLELKAQLEKIESATKSVSGRNLTGYRREIWQKLIGKKDEMQHEHNKIVNEIDELKKRLKLLPGGEVHVLGTLHLDVKITIGIASYTALAPIDFATFKYKGGQIVFTSYELAK